MTTPKRFSRNLILILILALPCTMAMVAVPSENSIIEASCSQCHSLKKVCKKLGHKNLPAWQKTLTRMQAKGSKITNEQSTRIAAFLTKNDTATSEFCK